MSWIGKWLESRAEEKADLKRRTSKLTERARPYRMSHVMKRAINDLGLKPHKDPNVYEASSAVDVTYEVSESTHIRGWGKSREPYHVASIVERQLGDFYDLAYERYTTWREKFEPVISLMLLENGEFQLKRPYERPVRIGTTRKIRESKQLIAAIRSHIKR